ncbi:hypothetical protein HYPSUDRAFT_59467 [Hypholoma sublateritium FD-334 SS-4]|uniref:phosphatidylserine decarboxylase n=1 Tax=Hypholoma sublateritium (strain FD-334 SS-4) TaxID=945553 RepID=A0A0D2P0T6_HYPSF|nr:hypothetical protein HYPSUDRAFT_59467 [Hypholoma sublateritium FD-334 SS-4]
MSAPPPTKGKKIARALKSAARLPRVPALRTGRASAARTALVPRPGEPPVVVLKLQVLGCTDVLAKDRGGTSDPFVVVTLLNSRQQTPVSKRTLSPTYAAKDATFEFPIYLSLADRLGVVELVVWDKDILKKDYLGEVAVPLDDWFNNRDFGFDHPRNTLRHASLQPFTLDLVSTRARTPTAGKITIKLGFATTSSNNLMDFDEIYGELVKRSRPSLVSAPPTEGVGTVRSTSAIGVSQQLQDDGGLSSDSDESDDDAEFVDASDTTPPNSGGPSGPSSRAASRSPKPLLDLYIPPEAERGAQTSAGTTSTVASATPASTTTSAGGIAVPQPRPAYPLPELHILPSSPATPTPGASLATAMPMTIEETPRPTAGFALPPTSASSPGSRFIPRKFVRKFSGLTSVGTASPTTPAEGMASPAVDMAGQLVPPSPGGREAKKNNERAKSAERRKKFGRSWSSSSGGNGGGGASSGSDTGAVHGEGGVPVGPASPSVETGSRMGWRRKSDFEFKGANDIVGIVMLEIQSADDLPRLANMTRTGWDMDPFVVISFGKKVFRTRVIRHSRSPVWDEKLLFHVRRYETAFRIQLTVLDWDKLSSNDHVGDAGLDLKELIEGAPQPDPVTGLYKLDGTEGTSGQEEGMKEFSRPLSTEKGMPWETKHSPVIRFKAKYQPYDALRQRFWRQYLKQYDTDDTSVLSHIELTSMLDSLGSTLTRTTVSSFFTRYGKDPHRDELTIDEAVACLEAELGRPDSEKKRLDADDGMPDTSVSATPILSAAGARGQELRLDLADLDFSGVPHVVAMGADQPGATPPVYTTEPSQIPLVDAAVAVGGTGNESSDLSSDAEGEFSLPSSTTSSPPAGSATPSGPAATDGSTPGGKKPRRMRFKRIKRASKTSHGDELSVPPTPSGADGSSAVERVINVKNCPLCHRPRLNAKAEIDIITHLAICASQDWNQVDRIVVGNFVTASQAQRKWYTKIIGKVSSGDYKLGANSANIIVQNRMTGQLEEEKMQVYVRLGIRLLYKGATSRMEGGRARRLLKSLSIKQGVKYDDPESAKGIPAFVQFHGLKVEEILDPLDSFKTFNEFFYRKLKPSARPIDGLNDPYRLVSAADCRLMTFESVNEATRLWIKGREFTIARLLGDAYKTEAERYVGGALAIFRLAPQDYHRFHSPVEGRIGKMTYISGEYYTVNAIRSSLDVYGENARKIVPIDSPQFGRVMAVCVGAMMVGTIKTTVEEGDYVKKGQEFGYFAFGGSTIVVLFEKGKVVWDEDLLVNGRASLETLVRVGMGIGWGRADA